MRPQEFLTAVQDQTIASLPESLQGASGRVRYGMLQLHYGDPRIHYEVWLVRKTERIEIGLHFEADGETNSAWAEGLAERALELCDALGPETEVEQWGPSWTRLHLTVPLCSLDERLCRDVAARLATLMRLTGEQVAALPVRERQRHVQTPGERGRNWRRRPRRLAGP